MLLHSLFQHFRRNGLALVVEEEPVRTLRMPYKTVSGHCYTVLNPEIHELVSFCKVVHSFCRMNLFHLHAVFSHNSVEMFLHNLHGRCIYTRRLPHVQCSSDKELVTNSIFQSFFIHHSSFVTSASHHYSATYRCGQNVFQIHGI